MNIEKQVISAETAIKLSVIGINEHSFFQWCENGLGGYWLDDNWVKEEQMYRVPKRHLPAFTETEMRAILNKYLKIPVLEYYQRYGLTAVMTFIHELGQVADHNPAESLALLLLYCHERGICKTIKEIEI